MADQGVADGLAGALDGADEPRWSSGAAEELLDPGPTRGVSSDGFRTTALPAATAAAVWRSGNASGKFQGAMTATTPSGSSGRPRLWRSTSCEKRNAPLAAPARGSPRATCTRRRHDQVMHVRLGQGLAGLRDDGLGDGPVVLDEGVGDALEQPAAGAERLPREAACAIRASRPPRRAPRAA